MWLSLPAKWTSQVTKLCCAVTMSSVPMRCGMPGPLIGPCLYYCHVITGHSDVLSLQEKSPCAGCCNHVLPLHCPHHKISPPPPPPPPPLPPCSGQCDGAGRHFYQQTQPPPPPQYLLPLADGTALAAKDNFPISGSRSCFVASCLPSQDVINMTNSQLVTTAGVGRGSGD